MYGGGLSSLGALRVSVILFISRYRMVISLTSLKGEFGLVKSQSSWSSIFLESKALEEHFGRPDARFHIRLVNEDAKRAIVSVLGVRSVSKAKVSSKY